MAPEARWERGLESVGAGAVDEAGTVETIEPLAGIEAATRLQLDLKLPTGQAVVCAVGARFVGDEHLILDLTDGRQIIACLVWFPRLSRATAAERGAWELADGGLRVLWREIGEQLLVPQLLGFSIEDRLGSGDDAPASGLISSRETAPVAALESGSLLAPAPDVPSYPPSGSPIWSSAPGMDYV